MDCGIVNEDDGGYIRLYPSKAQIEWLLIKTSLVVHSPLTVEAAARFKFGMGFNGDKVVGYKTHHKRIRTFGYERSQEAHGFNSIIAKSPLILNHFEPMSMPSMNRIHSLIYLSIHSKGVVYYTSWVSCTVLDMQVMRWIRYVPFLQRAPWGAMHIFISLEKMPERPLYEFSKVNNYQKSSWAIILNTLSAGTVVIMLVADHLGLLSHVKSGKCFFSSTMFHVS